MTCSFAFLLAHLECTGRASALPPSLALGLGLVAVFVLAKC